MSLQVTVSEKGQITLPQSLRQRLHMEPGTRLALDAMGDGSLRLTVLNRGAQGLFGLLQRPDQSVLSTEDMEAAVSAAVRERAGAATPSDDPSGGT